MNLDFPIMFKNNKEVDALYILKDILECTFDSKGCVIASTKLSMSKDIKFNCSRLLCSNCAFHLVNSKRLLNTDKKHKLEKVLDA